MSICPEPSQPVAPPIRVLVADDEILLRTSLADALRAVAADAVEVVAQCGTREEVLRETRAKRPHAVLLDLRMPDREGAPCTLEGAATVAALLRQSRKSRVVCLTAHEDAELVRACLDAGASGFLGKGTLPGEVWEAIRAVCAGRTVVEAQLRGGAEPCATASPESLRRQLLAGRRGEVLRLLLDGYSPTEIAQALPIGKKQVDKKIAEIKRLLGVATHIRLYRRCRQLGLAEG